MTNNKYLEKIAQTLSGSDNKRKDPFLSFAKGAIGSVAAGSVAGLGAVGQIGYSGAKKSKYTKEELRSVRSYLRSSGLGSGVKFEKYLHPAGPHMRPNINPSSKYHASRSKDTVDHTLDAIFSGKGGSYSPRKRFIVNNPTADFNILMHELGHAKDFSKHAPIKNGLAYMRVAGPALALAGGTAAISNKKTEKYAPAIAALPALPTLHSELTADYHAVRHIGKTLGAKRVGKYVGSHILPKLSYVGATLAPAVGFHQVLKARRHNEALAKSKNKIKTK